MPLSQSQRIRAAIGWCVVELVEMADSGRPPRGRGDAEALNAIVDAGARLLQPAPQVFEALDLPEDLDHAVDVLVPIPTTLGRDFVVAVRRDPAGRAAYLMRGGPGFGAVDLRALRERTRELLESTAIKRAAEASSVPLLPPTPAPRATGDEDDRLRAAIEAAGGTDADRFGLLSRYAAPCLSLTADEAEGRRSRFGGVPFAPAGTDWPRRDNGRPLHFIAQIDTLELPDTPMVSLLPSGGLLLFFYDGEEVADAPDSAAVIFVPMVDRLEPLIPPADTLDGFVRPVAGMSFSIDASVEVYDEWLDDGQLEPALRARRPAPSCHRALGRPEPIQGDPRQHIPNVIADDCRLLLQIDCGDPLGFEFGDSGRIYYLIGEDALRNRQWDEVRVVLDCC
jgi:hypothetical protein